MLSIFILAFLYFYSALSTAIALMGLKWMEIMLIFFNKTKLDMCTCFYIAFWKNLNHNGIHINDKNGEEKLKKVK